MALATTQKFSELVLEFNTGTPGSPVWEKLAGLIDVEISRSSNLDQAEVPDIDDESLPLSVERSVRSIEVSVSGSGVWAQESHGEIMDWFYSSASKEIRIQNANAASGDTEFEEGPAFLVSFTHQRNKGQKVQASLEIQFDGSPTRTAKV